MKPNEIIAIFKEEGLDLPEELVVHAIRVVFKMLATMLPRVNPILAMVVAPMLSQLEPVLLDIVDKIDGKDNPAY